MRQVAQLFVEMNSYSAFSQFALHQFYRNRPLVLRGHVTNASFKQWVGILLMPKINRAQKLSYTRNLRGNAFKGYILWHFDLSTK